MLAQSLTGIPAEVSIRRSNANLHFSKGATLMPNTNSKVYQVCFVSYLKNKNKKESLLKAAQLNMAKQPQVA